MKPTPIPKSFASLLNPAFWSKISRITSLQYTWDILWMRKYFLVAVGSLESDLVMQTAIHHISAKKLWWLKEANLQVSFFFSDIIILILLKHKEAFSTLVESLVQMTCSDFTIFLELAGFAIYIKRLLLWKVASVLTYLQIICQIKVSIRLFCWKTCFIWQTRPI